VIEIVNGYLCMNCCDVDKARLGIDPHQYINQIQKQLDQHLDKSAHGDFGPAVTYGGSLQGGLSGTASAGPPSSASASAANGPSVSSNIDLLA
jgi:hypothetical protein